MQTLQQIKEQCKPMVYPVKSGNGIQEYLVKRDYNGWTCTCRDFMFRGYDSNGNRTSHDCKHIKEIRGKGLLIGVVGPQQATSIEGRKGSTDAGTMMVRQD